MQYLHAYIQWETMGISGIPAIPMIITCLLQGTLCDTGIPRTFYGGKICSVECCWNASKIKSCLEISLTKLHHDLMFNLIPRNPIINVTYDTLADRLQADTKKNYEKRNLWWISTDSLWSVKLLTFGLFLFRRFAIKIATEPSYIYSYLKKLLFYTHGLNHEW